MIKSLRTQKCIPGLSLCRSAPLPIRVEGFSVGAVIGFSAQDTLVCLANDDDINSFKAVS